MLPPKEAVNGLDGPLSRLAVLARQGDGARLRGEISKAGLGTPSGGVQAIAEMEENDTDAVARTVQDAGGSVQGAAGHLLQVEVPAASLETLAQSPGVKLLRAPYRPVPLDVRSEDLNAIGLERWQQFGLQGQGVRIGVLDVGFESHARLIGSELPPDTVARSFRGDGDITAGGDRHGTATAEIIADVAPRATLLLANFSTEVELSQAVDWLIAQNVTVISSAVGWPGTAFGDGRGTINDIVKKADRAGVLWVQGAGNFAQTHWAGQFSDMDGNGMHNFTPTDEGNTITLQRPNPRDEGIFRVEVFLTWDDWDTFTQDYDLFLWRKGEQLAVAQSTAFQMGKFPPVEHIVFTTVLPGDYWIGIQRFRATRAARLDMVVTIDFNLEHRVAQGSLVVPGDSPVALTVGAVEPGSIALRAYSSQGPTKDGRTKPDVVAGDQVSTVSFGPQGLTGTSASAPYVAGAAALIKSARPSLSPLQLREFLVVRATGPGAAAQNNLIGAGRLALGEPPGNLFFPIAGRLSAFPP